MRGSLKLLNDIIGNVVIWLMSVYGLSKFVGGGSWRWSIIIVGGACLALIINRLIVNLYTRYAPDRLKDSTIRVGPNDGIARTGTADRGNVR